MARSNQYNDPEVRRAVRPIPTVLFLFALAGCGGNDATSPSPIDVVVSVAHGRTVVAGDGVSLRFDAVTEDSRCPINAVCVWAGVAVVKATILEGRRETPVEIRSDPPASRTASAVDVRVEWQQLEPYPLAGRRTDPAEYRLTVRITR